jgi:hypothetical protein
MKKFLIVLLFGITVQLSGYGQTPMPEIVPADIPGGQILRTDHYEGNSLWGYIDGGADLYLEYGFRRLSTQQLLVHGDKLTVEIFRMENPEAAFGIFSLTRQKCLPGDSLPGYSCISPFQIQAVAGSYYLSVTNETGTPRDQEEAQSLTRLIVSRTDGPSYSPPDIFQNKRFLPFLGGLKLIRGSLGLQNGIPEWEEKFDGTGMFSLYLLAVDPDTASTTVSLIRFGTANGIGQFYKNIHLTPDGTMHYACATEGSKTRCVVEKPGGEVYYIESAVGVEKVMEIVSMLMER